MCEAGSFIVRILTGIRRAAVLFSVGAVVLRGGTGQLSAEIPPFPAWGADAVPDLYAPNIAGPGGFTTTTGGAPASALNPAQGGTAQRIVFDIGYLGIPGFGNEKKYGNAIEGGMLFPTRYGVFGGSLRFIQSPFDDFPVRTTFGGNLNAAKELYPGMSLGMGLNFGFGFNDTWTLAADFGFHYNMGKLGPLHNFTWAAVLRGMGKTWAPTWFNPMGGVSFDLLRVDGEGDKRDPFVLNVAADMGIPSLFYFPKTSFIFKSGLKMTIAELVTLSLSWPGGSGLNVRELAEGGSFPAVPSVGLGFDFVLPSGGKRIAGGRLPSDGDLAFDTAYKPLYNGVTALGAGLTWTAGVIDKKPPVIELDYQQTAYFSPNNDGKADFLEFPVSITDSRYVAGWVMEITDENGAVARTYRNKELRPETQGMQGFFNRLFAEKKAVEVPSTLRWDGIGDSGELMPDGRYFFTITASDDNGNTGTSPVFEVVLDNTPPEVVIESVPDADRVFSPDGDGSKDTITFNVRGSEEEAWVSGIWNAAGVEVRSFETKHGRPGPQEWDGKDNNGTIVPDGVYSYRIGAIDRAQNGASAIMENIVVSTIQPQVRILITDAWFSPNGDGIKDTVIMNLSSQVSEGISGWTILIKDSKGAVTRTIRGGQAGGAGSVWTGGQAALPGQTILPEQFAYDGTNDSGAVLPEGDYRAELAVTYRNGYVSTAVSPGFHLDITPPTASVRADYLAFSPNNDGNQDEMIFRQEGSRELVWTGEIRRVNGPPGENAVRSFRFTGSMPPVQRWDGHGDAGTFAADGEYTYELYATDQAGNTGRSNILRFRLSTADTPVMITTDLRAFSPNGDGVKDVITLKPQYQVKDGIVSHKIEVLSAAKRAVQTFEGRGAPPVSVVWNGRTGVNAIAPDGEYTARLELRYEQGNQPVALSLPFTLDTKAPGAEISAPYAVFSPNGRRPNIPFAVRADDAEEWEAAIVNSRGQPVRTWNWTGAAPAIVWDGKDRAGNNAPDGTYQFTLQAVDAAGNSAKFNIPNVVLDARVPRLILTASAAGIAPKPNQSGDLVRFGVICSPQDGIESWNLELKDEQGRVLRRFVSAAAGSAGTTPPPASIGWNGLSDSGAVREGRYTPVLTVNYIKGDTASAEAAAVLVDISGPDLSFNYRPQYFSPDNDGVDDDLFISIEAKDVSPIDSWSLEIREPQPPYLLFYKFEGKGSPAGTLEWDGRSNKGELVQAATDYPVTFTAVDALGNRSTIERKIGVDVLVIRDGDRLRIQIPSIIFRENAADFVGLPAAVVENNMRVLRRLAEILNKFRDYKIQVEGHANPVLQTEREEREALQPLSEARARAVVNMLVELGVARSRQSAAGVGGKRPIVKHADHDNWWKNRRVEFILIK
jgi:flagellar hook assembly protein FlgD/flagellar motor protein MotB